MDLSQIVNQVPGAPPITPRTGRQSSTASQGISPTPPSTAGTQASRPSPIHTQSPVPPSKSASSKPARRAPPIWAQRFNWPGLAAGQDIPPPQRQIPQHVQQSLQQAVLPPSASLKPDPDGAPAPEPNFQNIEPWDEVTRQVCDFLWNHIISREDLQLARSTVKVEVEGKLGTLVDKDTNQRLELPVASQCVLTKPPEKLAFKSFMNEHQHRYLNKCLNEEVARSVKEPRRAKIHYEHLRETDSFHKLDRGSIGLLPPVAISYLSGQNRNPRVRISQDSRTKQVKARIIKARVADLDIYSPREAFDCRISINLEIECPEDVGLERSDDGPRVKDRMSYKHQNCQIDLTQVSQADPNSAKTHELEVELGTDALIDQGNLAKQNVDNAYEDLVKQFVSNIRSLSRIVTSLSVPVMM